MTRTWPDRAVTSSDGNRSATPDFASNACRPFLVENRARRTNGLPDTSTFAGLSEPQARKLPFGRSPTVTRVLGYASLPALDNGASKGALQSLSDAIAAACKRRDLLLLDVVHEREPRRGRALERPALGYALKRIEGGEADGLVVAELARLTRSTSELGPVLEWFVQSGARLVSVEPALDTADEGGRLAVQVIVELLRSERQRLIERMRAGMREARRKGPPSVADYPELRNRIVAMREKGMTLQAIVDRLNSEGVPTVRGGVKWRPSSVQAVAGYRRPPYSPTLGGHTGARDQRD